jgi:hypothetical protein
MTTDPAAEIPGLRSEILGIQRDLSSVHADIRNVKSDHKNLERKVDKVSGLNGRVEQIAETQTSLLREQEKLAHQQKATQESVDTLRESFEQHRILTTAYNELAVADREWQAKFGRFEEARDMAASIIDVVASGHINRSTIVDVTQRLAIHTPRFWVAPATLAVAAWLDDNPRQHRQALASALALDYEKTSLYMALLLRDQDGRHKELQEWLGAYLSRLTPRNLPRHFQVIIDAVTSNALGADAAPRLVKRMDEWYAEEATRQDTADTAVKEWKRRLLRLGAQHGKHPDFSLLAANEKAWRVLSHRFSASQAIEQAARYFRERFETGADVSDDIQGNLAALLDELARTEGPDEAELNRVRRMNRAITQVKGDVKAAQELIWAQEEPRTRTLNIVAMVSQKAFPVPEGSQLPAPTVTELLSIMLSNNLIAAAADELRDELPAVGTVELTAGDQQWEYRFACDDEAKVTGPALEKQAEEQARRICAQIQSHADRRQGPLRWLKKWGCPSGLATAVGLGGATFIPGAPPELMIPAFIVAVPSILGMGRLPRMVRRATDQAEAEKRAVTQEIGKAARQLADLWQADRESADVHLPDLRGYLLSLTADSVGAATRQVESIPLPRTREFPSWTPRPPRRDPSIESEDDRLALDD